MAMPGTKGNTPLADSYFWWLCSQVEGARPGKKYKKFLRTLDKNEFYVLSNVPLDRNRATDGLKLREEWSRDNGGIGADRFPGKPCSVLEMMVALARRIEYNVHDDQHGDRTAKLFWEMIQNLGLKEFTDKDPGSQTYTRNNERILDEFMARDYASNGKGGLFPLKFPKENQRNVEIWYQMASWIEENYPE
jgi:hypothetical protein